jgi:phosphomevalonate kinase
MRSGHINVHSRTQRCTWRICISRPYTNVRSSTANDYVRITVSYVLSYLHLTTIPSIAVTILADNDYYSQSASPTYNQLVSLPRFNTLNIPIAEANKTGLGSSAALITSLTAALLVYLSDIDITSTIGKQTVHNLAQAAHCGAQGKVGSGFDIAAAVYGSCTYRRFEPTTLQDVLLDSEYYAAEFRRALRDVIDRAWDMEVIEFRLPRGLRVVMGDVAAGSATPGMVRSVLKWKASGDGENTWDALGKENAKLIQSFNKMRQFSPEEINGEICLGMYNTQRHSDSMVFKTLGEVTAGFEVRYFLPI